MAGYAIAPLQPPLPTAWNLPFQPDAGNQISILMSESADGLSVAATRQNAGNAAKAALGAGGVANAPAATGSARVMVAPGISSEASCSHNRGAAMVNPPAASSAKTS